MHFKILKKIATSGFLTALECTKFVFGRGSAPDPTDGGAYSAPRPPSWIKGRGALLLRGRGEQGEKRGRKGGDGKGGAGGEERGGEGRGRKERGRERKEGEWRRRGSRRNPPFWKFLDPPLGASPPGKF